jgi:hypothetical protein
MSLMLFDTLQAEQISLRSFVRNLGDSTFIVRTCEKQVCTLRVSPMPAVPLGLRTRYAYACGTKSAYASSLGPETLLCPTGRLPPTGLVSPTRAEVSTPVVLLRDCPSLVFVYLNVGLTYELPALTAPVDGFLRPVQ